MMRGLAGVAVALVTVAAACTQSTATSGATLGVEAAGERGERACPAAARILDGPSPFERALAQWANSTGTAERGAGDGPARAALEEACRASESSRARDVTRQADRGTDEAACVLLGLVYAAGEGVPRDPLAANAYFARGASCSFSFGAMDLAQAPPMHGIRSSGVGCCAGRSCAAGCEAACDEARAAVLAAVVPPLEKACDHGSAAGCFMLARIIVPKDGEDGSGGQYVQEIGWVGARSARDPDALVELACDRGLGLACHYASYRHEAEDDAARPYEDDRLLPEALALLRRGCNLGWGDACLKLGQHEDRARHHAAAVALWERACALGFTAVCRELPAERDAP